VRTVIASNRVSLLIDDAGVVRYLLDDRS